ncbi:MAG: YncE family protein [Bacteroidetes bacterium]|nr:YncE family protein [Bacteroidota bacterium]
MKKLNYIFACLLLLFCSFNIKAQSYKIANKYTLEGDGGWDYLISDDSTGRLFISHGTAVQVVNASNGSLIGTIPDTKGVHGIALARDLNKGFISNGKDTSVTIFDLTTLATITKIKVTGKNPDAILYDPFSQKVFVFNGRTSNSTVIDAKTNSVIATIELIGKPEFSVTNGKGKIYVNIEDKSKICVINAATLKVEETWSIGKGEEPSGLALDNKNHRLFSVCDNKLMIVLDAENGKTIASLPIGENVDGAAFDPEKERAFSSNGDGTLTVVQGQNGNNYKVIDNLNTLKGARTVTINTKTHHLYLPTAEFGAAPDPTKENPKPRPAIKPGSFTILDIVPDK